MDILVYAEVLKSKMSGKYKNTVCTKQLSRQECKNCLDEIIDILKINQVREIEMMFGFAWGNNYKDWTPFKVPVDEITIEIDKAERSGTGNFYNDDTFLYLPENSELLFCHEYDIHLEFDHSNMVVNAYYRSLEKKGCDFVFYARLCRIRSWMAGLIFLLKT